MLKLVFERMREAVEVISRFYADCTEKPVMEIAFEATDTRGVLRSPFLNRVLVLPAGLEGEKNKVAIFNWLKLEVKRFVRDSYAESMQRDFQVEHTYKQVLGPIVVEGKETSDTQLLALLAAIAWTKGNTTAEEASAMAVEFVLSAREKKEILAKTVQRSN